MRCLPSLARAALVTSLGAGALAASGSSATLRVTAPRGAGDLTIWAGQVTASSVGSPLQRLHEPTRFREGWSEVALDLPRFGDGSWIVLLEAPGAWAPPIRLADSGSEAAELQPGGILRLRFPPASAERLRKSLADAAFLLLAAELRPRPPRWEVRSVELWCRSLTPGDAGAWACPAPVGTLDLKVRLGRFATEFLQGLTIERHGVLATPEVVLRPGATVAGFGAPGSTVSLRPRSAARGRNAPPELQLATEEIQADAEGHFEFGGLHPGEYEVAAFWGPAVTTTPVIVEYYGQAVLVGDLAPPRLASLRVQVTPPQDFDGQRWRFVLAPVSGSTRNLMTQTSAPVELDGSLALDDLPEGQFLAQLFDSRGSTWWSEFIAVTGDSITEVEVPAIEVVGELRMGPESVEGTIVFGTTQRPVNVRMTSDANGDFGGFLPRQGLWEAELLLPQAGCGGCGEDGLMIAVEPVEVERGPSGKAFVKIVLPHTRLNGRVLSRASGQPAAGARVTVLRWGDEGQPQRREALFESNEEGRFEVTALAPGLVGAWARSADGAEESPWVGTQLLEGSTADITLLLERKRELLVAARSERGPIPGAFVLAAPAESARSIFEGFIHKGYTGAGGDLMLRLPAASSGADLVVSAPGYASRCLRVGLPQDRPLTVALSQVGGSLRLVGPPGVSPALVQARLLGPGGSLDTRLLRSALEDRIRWEEDAMVLELVEPGPYELCWSETDCVRGELAPFGELELRMRVAGERP